MSDLVGRPAAAAPRPAVEEEPPAAAAPPPSPSAPARLARPAPPPRMSFRANDVAPATTTTAPAAAPAPSPRPSVDSPKSLFEEVHVFLTGVRQNVSAGGTPSWPDVRRLLGRVESALEESAELFWLANASAVPAGIDYLVVHQSRVAILAVRIGLNVGYDRARAVGLGVAGALIDIGLWQAPEGLLRRLDSLTADEEVVYRAHPQRGAALLTQWGAPASLIEAVLQHHEREQGQGFPQRLTGGAITQDAKILGLVDAYTGLTLPPWRRPGLRPHEAIREIVRSKHESFSPALIKALLSEISVFPPGTLVRLNTGEVGQVTGVNRNHPLRPRVEVVLDPKGNAPVTAKTIDLSETPFLYITGAVTDSAK